MRKFIINPLSANGQCHTIQEVAVVFENLIASIKYVWPMIRRNRASLFYSPCSNAMSLRPNEPFEVTVNELRSINGDLPRLWYMYTKNQPILNSENEVEITISSINPPLEPAINGVAKHDLMSASINWLSFGGVAINQASTYRISIDKMQEFDVNNAYNELSLQGLLPFFEHSEKHRAMSYFDNRRGEHVAGMPIRNRRDAGELLRNGIEYRGDFFSYHCISDKFFRFKQTRVNIYHGFQIEPNEVPNNLLVALKV
jgi:hypothetical protein